MSVQYKVSDSMSIPYRGHLLRLKVAAGTPSVKQMKTGARLRVRGPDGEEGEVDVIGHAKMGGQPTQARLERTRELDVVIPAAQAVIDGARIEIGWTLTPHDDEQ